MVVTSISCCTLFAPNNNPMNHASPSEQRTIGKTYLEFLQSISKEKREEMEQDFRTEEANDEAGIIKKEKPNTLFKSVVIKNILAANSQQ